MDCLIHHMLQSSAARLPDKEALLDKDVRLNFQTAAKNVAGLAEGLRKAGLSRGDRVGIYLETSVLQSLSIFGVSQAGGVFVPINGLLFPQQVAHIARRCSAAELNQLMTAIQQGGTYVPMTFVFAREIVKTLQREQITGMAGVPTLWSLMSQPSSSLAREPLPHLRYITNTGGRMPQTVLANLRPMLPSTRIFLMYGLTKALRSTYLPPEELRSAADLNGQGHSEYGNSRGQRTRPAL